MSSGGEPPPHTKWAGPRLAVAKSKTRTGGSPGPLSNPQTALSHVYLERAPGPHAKSEVPTGLWPCAWREPRPIHSGPVCISLSPSPKCQLVGPQGRTCEPLKASVVDHLWLLRTSAFSVATPTSTTQNRTRPSQRRQLASGLARGRDETGALQGLWCLGRLPPPSVRRCRAHWWEVWYTNLAKVGLTLSDS